MLCVGGTTELKFLEVKLTIYFILTRCVKQERKNPFKYMATVSWATTSTYILKLMT